MFRVQFILIASIFIVLASLIYFGVPSVMQALAVADSEKHSFSALKKLSKEFDLPGEISEAAVAEQSILKMLLNTVLSLGLNHDKEIEDSDQIDVFKIDAFESERHLGQIRGIVVFNSMGDRFISTGQPLSRTLDVNSRKQEFDDVITSGKISTFVDDNGDYKKDRILTVVIPLFRFGEPYSVAFVDVARSEFEKKLFLAIGYFIGMLVFVVFLIAFSIVFMVFQHDRRRSLASREAEYLAYHDPLTELPNRRAFEDYFEQIGNNLHMSDDALNLIIVDIDYFKVVNDTYGHVVGDQILKLVGDRLRVLAAGGFVARLSGDEFAILIKERMASDVFEKTCNTIVEAFSSDVLFADSSIPIKVSVGAVLHIDGVVEFEDLHRRADHGLFKAKQDGRARAFVFDEAFALEFERKALFTKELRSAIRSQEMEVFYQSQVDVHTMEIVGYEALVRWKHRTLGYVSPVEFIGLAEEIGLIAELDIWVLRTACKAASRWSNDRSIAVNISPKLFLDGNFCNSVRDALAESGLEPGRLELEITEGLMLHDSVEISQTLEKLRALGVGLAMDDFGTGFSSLNYLTRIPITKIKIDRSFVWQLDECESTDTVVEAIFNIGRRLKVKIIAEGVETPKQLKLLQDHGCTLVQGFLFGRPQPDPAPTLVDEKMIA